MIKVDFQNRFFVAQKAIAMGFQAVLFTDHQNAEQVKETLWATAPEAPQYGGRFGYPNARWIGYNPEPSQMVYAAMNAGQGDVMKQNQCVEDLINRKADLIMIIPIDANGNIPAVNEALEAGIPVITLDATVNVENENLYYVGASDYEAGVAQAQYLAEVLPEAAKVLVILGQEGMSNAQSRRDGAVETLSELRPDVEFLAEQPGDWDEAKCMDIVEDWCQAFPEFDAVICGGDSMALGTEEALEQAGRLEGVYITGVDCIDAVVNLMKEGKISMSAQHTAAMCAEKGFNYATHVLAGENPEDYIWQYVAVTKDNVNEFYPED